MVVQQNNCRVRAGGIWRQHQRGNPVIVGYVEGQLLGDIGSPVFSHERLRREGDCRRRGQQRLPKQHTSLLSPLIKIMRVAREPRVRVGHLRFQLLPGGGEIAIYDALALPVMGINAGGGQQGEGQKRSAGWHSGSI